MCALSREYCKPYLHLVFSVKYGWLIHSSCIIIYYCIIHTHIHVMILMKYKPVLKEACVNLSCYF